LTTGDELQTPGRKLKPAQIYESNSFTLEALLHEMNLNKLNISRIPDNPEKLFAGFKKAIRQQDVIIITGGVSVGDYDYVEHVLEKLKVNMIFHNVSQKPGRPMYFGTFKNKLIFALPGNPASVMVCFYEYIYPALRKMMGHVSYSLPGAEAICTSDYNKKPGLTHFLKAFASGDQVEILEGQESFFYPPLRKPIAWPSFPSFSTGVKSGEKVIVHFIDHL
jgi:molybdopterin molybdotransferase